MVGFAVFASSGGFARGWLVPRGGMGVGDPPTLRANDEHEDWRSPSLKNVKLGTKKTFGKPFFSQMFFFVLSWKGQIGQK